MTELEPREDDWARGVFDRVWTGHDEPHWIPDAAAASEQSTRYRRRRTRVTGALTAAAVIGLSTTAYATLGGGESRDGRPVVTPPGATSPPSAAAPATTSPSTAPTTTARATLSTQPSQNPTTSATQHTVADADLGRYFQITGGSSGGPDMAHAHPGATAWSATGLSTIGTVWQSMDPDLAHVRGLGDQSKLSVGLPSGARQLEIDASAFWTPNSAVSPLDRPTSPPTAPFGYVTISTTSPAALDDGKPAGPCAIPDHAFGRSLYGIPTAWSPCEKHPLSDGSAVISAHALNVASGTVTIAAREFPSGAIVLVTATSYIVYDTPPGQNMGFSGAWTAQPPNYTASPSLPSVPWTDDSLVAALSAPGVKALP